ncbi:MAG: thiamine pyrophosphate-dependent dehydrogenase E1 component subunit alpha [Oscillospiraceae bacterium]|jgi:pyruvate dehydrogenase E1 component alpha subunit|nr:thiamine pyrophosphate-dependent dehydrogenase E1 component subunit alpha [Oscillospiraceae bacterium]
MDKKKMTELYRTMVRIRMVEERIAAEYKYDEIKTPIHLSIGQEAVAAGVCTHLKKDDYLFGTHRSHAQYLAKGGDLKKMIAELYLRRTGCSHGRGGSMHLAAPEVGILGTSAIVGGDIPLGTGTALASRLKKDGKVTAVFFGDGAADEGTFHESLGFAALKNLPVLYVCENNHYAINSRENQRHRNLNIAQWAQGYGIPSRKINGNDVIEVSKYAEEAIGLCRKGEGPAFLECGTYRWKGHIGTVDDVGDGFRSREEYDYWLSKCPIRWYREYLESIGLWDDAGEETLREQISAEIQDAFLFAKASPKPSPDELMDYVYAS